MRRTIGFLLFCGGVVCLSWAGLTLCNVYVYPLVPALPAPLRAASPTAFWLLHGGMVLVGLAAAVLGGWLALAADTLAAARYRQATGRRLPLLHRTRLCRVLRRMAVLVWLASAALLLHEVVTDGVGDARFRLGQLLPALIPATMLFFGGVFGSIRRCPQCGSRLCRDGEEDDRLPPVWLEEDEEWPQEESARFCPVCGFEE